jgi:hypothetical protein
MSGRRPVMKRRAPSAAKRFAVARPMPDVAPVMTAIFPFSLCVIAVVSFCSTDEEIWTALSFRNRKI